MAKVVQRSRGPRSEMDSYTGPEGEITIVTDTIELRVHDGITMGGHRFPSLPDQEKRFQAASPELTDIAGIKSSGVLVRRGLADWAVRKIQGLAGEIVVLDGVGHDGDISIGLPDSITVDITFAGEVTFGKTILGNLKGDTEGSHVGPVTGDVTGNVTGDVVGNLTGNAHGDHTGSFTGDLDVRGATVQFDEGQIPAAAIADLPDRRFLVPAGGIIMWSGTTPPAGWYLCDGQNGTPDLRDRFIVAAGPNHALNSTGGSATHNHDGVLTSSAAGAHTHSLTIADHILTTNQIPQHDHYVASNKVIEEAPAYDGDYIVVQSWRGGDTSYRLGGTNDPLPTLGKTSKVGAGQGHSHGHTMGSVPSHTHDTTIPAASNEPLYYALAFIQKSQEV